jgi:hypothetical protein
LKASRLYLKTLVLKEVCNASLRYAENLFSLHAQLTSSEVEFVKGIPEGGGVMLGDGAFNVRPILNAVASKGYIPIVKKAREALGVMERG